MKKTRKIDGFPKTNQMKEIIVREATDFGDDYKAPRVPNYIKKNIAKNVSFQLMDILLYLY